MHTHTRQRQECGQILASSKAAALDAHTIGLISLRECVAKTLCVHNAPASHLATEQIQIQRGARSYRKWASSAVALSRVQHQASEAPAGPHKQRDNLSRTRWISNRSRRRLNAKRTIVNQTNIAHSCCMHHKHTRARARTQMNCTGSTGKTSSLPSSNDKEAPGNLCVSMNATATSRRALVFCVCASIMCGN